MRCLKTLLVVAAGILLPGAAAFAKADGLQFVKNGRQWPEAVRYKAELPGGAVFLTNTGFTYSYYSLADVARIHDLKHERGGPATSVSDEIVHRHAYSVTLAGGNTGAENVPGRKLPNYYNYFLGNDPAQWSGGMPAYEGIRYAGVYPGIDLSVYSREGALKYDFDVAPGADASAIRLVFDGVTPVIDGKGNLMIKTSVNELRELAPYAYQMQDGRRRKVACSFSLEGNTLRFSFPRGYDHSLALVIDPVLIFATYSGGTGSTYGWSATYDSNGNLYAGGESFGTGWPVTTGAFQTTFGGSIDDGINKYSSSGSSLIYSTYYGGSSGDFPNTMVVNSAGELVIAGATQSTNLPTTSGCYDASHNGGTDVYVAHFNAGGTALIGATYIGGSGNEGNVSTGAGYEANRGEVITDASGNIYVGAGTTSSNFPTTTGAYQTSLSGSMDGFVCKLNGNCSSLSFCTYLGGSGNDAVLSLQLNSSGNIVVGGGTASSNFPGTSSGWQSSNQGGTDGFIAILNSSGTTLSAATYVGTTGTDNVTKIQVDATNNVYAMGVNSGGAFPTTTGVYKVASGKIYIARFSPALGSNLASTTIGSSSFQLTPSAFLLDICDHVYFVGYSASSGLALTSNAYQSTAGGFWMCVLNPAFSSLYYASYFGATGDHIDGGSSRMDPQGIVYHSICTSSTTLPTTSSSWSPTKLGSGYDIASWKFNFQAIGMAAGFNLGTADTFCAPAQISFNNTSYGALSYLWDFGDGSPASTVAVPPPHSYATPGTYRIALYTYNSTSCGTIDSAFRTIVVKSTAIHAQAALTTNDSGCAPFTVAFSNATAGAATYDWDWNDGTPNGTTATPTHTYVTPGTYTIRYVAAHPDSCRSHDTLSFTVTALPPGAHAVLNITGNDSLCIPGTVQFNNTSTGATSYLWDFGDGSPTITAASPPPHTYTAAGAYTVRFYAYNNYPWACIPVDSARLTIRAFDIQTPKLTTRDTLVCEPDRIKISVGIANYANTMSLLWSPAASIYSNPRQATVEVDATQGQLYSVVVTNSMRGVCTKSAMATTEVKLWNRFVAGGDTTICPHDSAQLSVVGAYDKVRWTPAVYLSDAASMQPKASPPTETTYLMLGSYKHCVDTERVTVRIAPGAVIALPDSVKLFPGDTYQLSPQGNGMYFNWFPYDGLSSHTVSNPIASPPVNTRYYVTTRTEFGCLAKDSITIMVSPDSYLDVPNAFAPGNGPNSHLFVMHSGVAKLQSFRVYNRWGQLVFQTADLNEGWDGRFNGVPQPIGVYVYTAEAVTPTGRRFYKQGNVTLLR